MPRFSSYAYSHVHTTSPSQVHLGEEIRAIVTDYYTAYDTLGLSQVLSSSDLLILADYLLCMGAIEGKTNTVVVLQSQNRKQVDLQGAATFIKEHLGDLYRIGNKVLSDENSDENERLSGEVLKNIAIALGYNPTSSLSAGHSSASATNSVSPAATTRNTHLDCIMYRAKNGEIALKFKTEAEKNNFLDQLTANGFSSDNTVATQYRNGRQYFYNREGKNPITYSTAPNTIYFMTYGAKERELGVNLGSESNRNALLQTLGYPTTAGVVSGMSPDDQRRFANAMIPININNSEGATFFQYYGGSQSSTLYFNPTSFFNNNHVQFKGSSPAEVRKMDHVDENLLEELRKKRDEDMKKLLEIIIVDRNLTKLPEFFNTDSLFEEPVQSIMKQANIISNAILTGDFVHPKVDMAISYIKKNIGNIPGEAFIASRRKQISIWIASVQNYQEVSSSSSNAVVNEQPETQRNEGIHKQYKGGR